MALRLLNFEFDCHDLVSCSTIGQILCAVLLLVQSCTLFCFWSDLVHCSTIGWLDRSKRQVRSHMNLDYHAIHGALSRMAVYSVYFNLAAMTSGLSPELLPPFQQHMCACHLRIGGAAQVSMSPAQEGRPVLSLLQTAGASGLSAATMAAGAWAMSSTSTLRRPRGPRCPVFLAPLQPFSNTVATIR